MITKSLIKVQKEEGVFITLFDFRRVLNTGMRRNYIDSLYRGAFYNLDKR